MVYPLPEDLSIIMLRAVFAGIAGVIASSVSVFVVEHFSHMVYPLPEGLEALDYEAMSKFVTTLPTMAIVLVWLGWQAGAFMGTFVCTKIAPRSKVPQWIVTWFFFAACAFNMISLPCPGWFIAAVCITTPVVAYEGWALAKRGL
eukprot:TRINITY_DN94_c0_g1_i1.p1 TRINITY_DN94_c0_g1~~TRINITY_DN94_c0_g1_i1.p1  ORF type:complete len:145 (+),score=34.21 TRINITY_DN94_c0_g1_i1:2-436(+)